MSTFRPQPTSDLIADSGLRYTQKAANSAYTSYSTMSCLRCGQHKPRSALRATKLAGKTHYVCQVPCKK